MRDHSPITLENFNGLWARAPIDSCPQDHFSDCGNITMTQGGFRTRDGLDTYFPLQNIKRIYTYVQPTKESLLVLDSSGNIYDTGSSTPNVPILTISSMTDFAFVSINGRAYISPNDGTQGLTGEHIYVYLGDGVAARTIAGSTSISSFAGVASTTAGNIEKGDHLYAVVWESTTGFLTPPSIAIKVTSDGTKKVDLSWGSAIPVGKFSYRWVIATKAIQNYNGNTTGYQFFFVPGSRTAVGDGTETVNFYDAELIADASYLLDLFSNVSAGVGLTTYHNRLISWSEYGSTSTIRVSFPNEPEAIDQVDGLLSAPLDSLPVTNCQEYRDVLYVYKQNKTIGFPDNGDVPSTWIPGKVDSGIGTFIHGIGTILDTNGANVDFLVILTLGGIYLFNGTYLKPELSWKIRDFWTEQDADDFSSFQVVIDSVNQLIYVNLLSSTILVGDYSQGSDPFKIRWAKWTFDIETNTIALVNSTQLIIGSEQAS